MKAISNLLDEFRALNERKRLDPKSLAQEERERWKELRREIEKILFQTAPDPAADTREFLRVPVSLSVRYWTASELKDRYIPILGEGGLFVSTVDPLPVGSEMDLEIVLARKGLSIRVKGTVMWVNEGEDPARRGMGIKFADLSYAQKSGIYSLVDDTLHQRLLERRRFARVDARLQVSFVYAEGFFELKSEDLSLGGMFIATEHLVPVGERVRLILHLPGGQPAVKALGEVARVVEEANAGQPAGLGIRFVELEAQGEQTIRTYLGLRASGALGDDQVDRRQHPRVERLVKLRFQSVESFGTRLARDISTGGVFIQTHEPPPVGSEIQLTLIHPVNLSKLELLGRVVRIVLPEPSKPQQIPGVGVAFVEASEEKRSALREFLKDFALLEAGEAFLKLEGEAQQDPDHKPTG